MLEIPSWRNTNCTVHTLGAGCPLTWAGWKRHFLAASSALPAKYRLPPADWMEAPETDPVASTETRIVTRTLPRMVWLAAAVTSGVIRSATSPRAEAPDVGEGSDGGGCGTAAGVEGAGD